jgi:hypothetical protein
VTPAGCPAAGDAHVPRGPREIASREIRFPFAETVLPCMRTYPRVIGVLRPGLS